MAKRNRKREGTCAMDGCKSDIHAGGLCSTCYGYVYRWQQRSPGDIVSRKEQIDMWITRLNTLTPHRKLKRNAA